MAMKDPTANFTKEVNTKNSEWTVLFDHTFKQVCWNSKSSIKYFDVLGES